MSDVINLFETRELIAAANQIPAATTFLQDTFFAKQHSCFPLNDIDRIYRPQSEDIREEDNQLAIRVDNKTIPIHDFSQSHIFCYLFFLNFYHGLIFLNELIIFFNCFKIYVISSSVLSLPRVILREP